jgi:methionyl-tRNA formyltransferase
MFSIVFFGTDEFAAQTLEALANAKGFEVVSVVTQPDRPVGRKQELEKPPVKIVAEKYNIPVEQPESLKNYSLPTTNYSLNIVYRYGLIIPQNILNIPTHGTINIHPSLLPKYRGPSPIQTAIMNGDNETAITIMLMDEKMDHGPILAQEKFAINPDDTYQTLSERMTPRVNEILLQTIPSFLSGEIKPQPQDDSVATVTKILSRDDGKIDWSKSASEIYNQYRALTPWPGVWTMWEGKRLKLLGLVPSPLRRGTKGEVSLDAGRIYISCSDGSLEVTELQLEGTKPMDAKTFLSGYRNIQGETLA